MHRVYFDGNELFARREQDGVLVDWYSLHLDGSQADMTAIPGGPREGMRVVLYTYELELGAELEYHEADQHWVGRYIPGTRQDVPYSES
jgi:hypothetical protein